MLQKSNKIETNQKSQYNIKQANKPKTCQKTNKKQPCLRNLHKCFREPASLSAQTYGAQCANLQAWLRKIHAFK